MSSWSYSSITSPQNLSAHPILTAFYVWDNGQMPRVYGLTSQGQYASVYELAYQNHSWKSTSSLAGNVAATDSALTGLSVFSGKEPRIYYIDTNQHVRELVYHNGQWTSNDLASNAVKGSPLTSFLSSSGEPRVYYINTDQHVCELAFQNGWTMQDITKKAGAVSPTKDSTLAGFIVSGEPRLYHFTSPRQGENGWDVYELAYQNGEWRGTNIMEKTQRQRPAKSVETLAGLAAKNHDRSSSGPQVYYIGLNNNVCELAYYHDQWNSHDVTEEAGGVPALDKSALSCFAIADAEPRVYHFISSPADANKGDVYELTYQNSAWHPADLTEMTSAPSATTNSGLAGLVVTNASGGNKQPRVYYVGDTDLQVYQLSYQ